MTFAALVVLAFLRRDWATERSYRLAFGFEAVALFTDILFYFFIAQLVDRADIEDELGTDSYFAFVLVGIVFVNVVMPALQTFAKNMRQEQVNGSLEALLATPASPVVMVLGSGAFDLVRGVVVALIYLVVAGWIFGVEINAGPLAGMAATVALAICAVLFTALGLVAATVTLVFKRGGAGVASMIGTGMTVLGGTYYPVSLLPSPVDDAARLLPNAWALDVARGALFRDQIEWAKLGGLAMVTAGAVPLALWFLARGLRQSRAEGSVAQY